MHTRYSLGFDTSSWSCVHSIKNTRNWFLTYRAYGYIGSFPVETQLKMDKRIKPWVNFHSNTTDLCIAIGSNATDITFLTNRHQSPITENIATIEHNLTWLQWFLRMLPKKKKSTCILRSISMSSHLSTSWSFFHSFEVIEKDSFSSSLPPSNAARNESLPL